VRPFAVRFVDSPKPSHGHHGAVLYALHREALRGTLESRLCAGLPIHPRIMLGHSATLSEPPRAISQDTHMYATIEGVQVEDIKTRREKAQGKHRRALPYVIKHLGKWRRVYRRSQGGHMEDYVTIQGRCFLVALHE
jgi:hypothetical protein